MKQWNKRFEKRNILCWYKRIMRRNMFTQWLYIITPFVITTILLILLNLDHVLLMGKNKFSFLKDTSNSICMISMFLFTYYLGGIVPKWIEKDIDILDKYTVNKKEINNVKVKISKIVPIMNRVLIMSLLFGLIFVNVAIQNKADWIIGISLKTKILYNVYLGLGWYCSVILLVYALVGGYVIKKILGSDNFRLFSITNCSEIKQDMLEISKYLSSVISYAVLYVVGAVVIIVNDNINTKYGLKMTFSNPLAAIVLIFLMIIGFSYVCIPTLEFSKVINREKNIEIKKCKRNKKREKEIQSISSFVFKSTIGKISLFISIGYPLIMLVLKIIQK